MVEIVKVQKISNDPTGLLIYFEANRIHRYWCDQREPLIQALSNNLRSWQSMTLQVEETSDIGPFDGFLATKEIPQPVSFELPVTKVGKKNKLKKRLLGLTQSSVIERDPETRRTLSSYSISDIFNLVLLQDRPGSFAMELKNGRTVRYFCETSALTSRTEQIGIGLESISVTEKQQLLASITDRTIPLPPRLSTAGSYTILDPEGAKMLLLCNIMELSRMNNVHLAWSLKHTPIGCKEGTWGTTCHPEWDDILLKKLATLTPSKSDEEIEKDVVEFNTNIAICGLKQRERRAFTSLLKLLEKHEERSPYTTTCILQSIHRLLCTKAVFDEVSSYKKHIKMVVKLIQSEHHGIALAAALVFKRMVVFDTKSIKVEAVNRRAVLTLDNCKEITNCIFRARQNQSEFEITSDSILDLVAPGKAVDYLVNSTLLQMFEVVLSSGKKGTTEKVFVEVLQAMQMTSFINRSALFELCRAPSFSIMKNASVLLRVHILEQTPEVVELLQNHARNEGILIWQLYLALVAHAKTQRRNSSQLVALLTHENARSSAVIRRIFPAALLGDIPTHTLTFDEYGTVIHGGDHGYVCTSPVVVRNDTTFNEPPQSLIPGSNRSKVVKQTKCVVLLPEFFDRVGKTHVDKDLLWNASAVSELCYAILDQLANLDLERLRHYHYVYSDPMRELEATEHATELPNDGMKSPVTSHGSETEESSIMLNGLWESTASPEKRHLMPSSSTSHHKLFIDTDIVEEEKESEDESPLIEQDPLEMHSLIWNHEEFGMLYHCFEDEVRVGAYYLANILSARGKLTTDVIDAPEEFLLLLYYRILAESNHGVQLLCLKVMTLVYGEYKHQIRSLQFLNHLIQSASGLVDPIRRWPQVVRSNVMLFVQHVLEDAANVHRFLQRSNVVIIIHLLCEVWSDVMQQASDVTDTRMPVSNEVKIRSDDEEDDDIEDDDVVSYGSFSSASPEKFRIESRGFVSVDHSAAMSATDITLIGIGILTKLVECHASLDSLSRTLFCPVPSVKIDMCVTHRHQVFDVIVKLLGYNQSRIFERALYILQLLVYRHDAVIPHIYQTGLFYYLLRFGQDNMKQVARFLYDVHLRQDITTNYSPPQLFTAPDPLTRLCLKSVLINVLPVSMIAQLVRHGPDNFAHAFLHNADNPEVVWNATMRQTMKDQIDAYMKEHPGTFLLEDDYTIDQILTPTKSIQGSPMKKITYPTQVDALQCYQYYLENLLDEERFPNWPINNQDAFLSALVDSIRYWITTSKLSNRDVELMLRVVCLLFRRFGQSSWSFTQFTGFQVLFKALDKCKSTGAVFNTALSAIALGSSCSSSNAEACSTAQGVRILIAALKKAQDPDAIEANLEALMHIMQQSTGRSAFSSSNQAVDGLVLITSYLDPSRIDEINLHSLQAGLLAVSILLAACQSQDFYCHLAEQGIVWQLVQVMFGYGPVNDYTPTQELRNEIALKAAEALGVILSTPTTEENHYIAALQVGIRRVLTGSLTNTLMEQGPEALVVILSSEVTLATIMWTKSMKQELWEVTSELIRDKRYTVPDTFMYTALKEELTVASIYLRFYNDQPETSTLPDPEHFMTTLISSLAHDISGVQQQPTALAAIVMRMEPVSESLRNMLAFTPGMDAVLLKLEGIPTVFTLLQSVFSGAPQLQLQALEILHLAVFSGKCLEAMAAVVPPYAGYLFRFLEDLPSGPSTIAGQAAHISLQLLGNLCILPSCIDSLVKGMDTNALARLLPEMCDKNAKDLQLLLAMYVTPLKRHTQSTMSFAKDAVRSQLVHSLLGMLSSGTISSNQLGQSGETKKCVARLLSVLSSK